MPKPQDPNLHRSGQVPALDPDATESELEGRDQPGQGDSPGPVPEGNRPKGGPDEDDA